MQADKAGSLVHTAAVGCKDHIAYCGINGRADNRSHARHRGPEDPENHNLPHRAAVRSFGGGKKNKMVDLITAKAEISAGKVRAEGGTSAGTNGFNAHWPE